MGQLAIIADDLSSCTDCGIQIARDGFQTFVVLDQSQDFKQIENLDVVAIDADSRAASPEEAYHRVKKATSLIQPYFRYIYKSVDSTLRGNLGVEIDAVMDVISFDLAIVAPAYPYYGRTTLDGIHYLHGQRINETEFASDPQCPIKEADLVKLFSSQSRRKVGKIGLDILHQTEAELSRQLTEYRLSRVELVVFDVQTEVDLDKIVRSASSSNLRVLWVGSTGLAGHISQILKPARNEFFRWQQYDDPQKPTLIVVGSASETTRNQVDFYKQQLGLFSVRMNPDRILPGGQSREQEFNRCRDELLGNLRCGNDAILEVASSRAEIAATQTIGQQCGLNYLQVSACIVESLAEITLAVVELFPVGGLILTGGDTAKAVCLRFEAKGILILKEVEPGIPLARLVGDHNLCIVTKAGGFGRLDTLMHANSVLKGRDKE